MPNVAGVQFPYTLPGVQAAQRYERSLSPRRGLGFRPIRMQKGGSLEGRAVADELRALQDDKTTTNQQVVNYVINNLKLLTEIAEEQPWIKGVIDGVTAYVAERDTESEFAAHIADVGGGMAAPTALVATGLGRQQALRDRQIPMNPLVATGLGRQEGLRAMGDTRPSDQDALLGPVFRGGNFSDVEKEYFQRAFDANRARNQAGTGPAPYLGVPETYDSGQLVWDADEAYAERKALEAEQLRAMQGPVSNPPLFPQGMRHGGVPRGTVAGELEPRGYLTARQAGETMRERAKGLRDRRNYGGGIGSLYNRYG